MYTVTTKPTSFEINCCPWNEYETSAKVCCSLWVSEEAFSVKFKVMESDPRRVHTQHLSAICQDSCVEFFPQFCPDTNKNYFNFEVNANGAMDAGFRASRKENTPLLPEEINSFNITTQIFDDYWTVSYDIPFAVIKKYIPQFSLSDGDVFRANLYKCGDLTEKEHYLSLFPVKTIEPDFHRPEYFGEFKIQL